MGFFLLFKPIAMLILTLIKMFADAKTFGILMVMYLSLALTVFMLLFQENSINYQSMLYSFRSLFDAMLGNYSHISTSDDQWLLHTGVMILHIVIAHVFLLNYLIAIMGTTYEEEEPKGAIAY